MGKNAVDSQCKYCSDLIQGEMIASLQSESDEAMQIFSCHFSFPRRISVQKPDL